ncbi:hypothetical protein [Parathalassolituus penaei]|uniref:Lipoprotein n=1 Tax=Parathalassolituus penaei TaxID=2997323 RepID=A0A9X3EM92_9GAMM|nr:hypothetical protein [Parathalassolituus penaei]MCY0965248.1 hypothetical protein [Parathalassolituus penaei]
MRALPILFSTVLASCVAVDNNAPIESSYDRAIALNGFWDGQFDQNGKLRFLVYEGKLYGTDGSRGYVGTVSYISSERSVGMVFDSYPITWANATAKHYASGGSVSGHYEVNGLLVEQTATTGTIAGDYRLGTSTAGSLVLNADGSWDNESNLWNLVGTWKAGNYSLYVSQLDGKNSFVGSGPSGCTFKGELFLLNSAYPLMKANLYERSNCSGFDISATVSGFAAMNQAGTLEMYLLNGTSMLIMNFSR